MSKFIDQIQNYTDRIYKKSGNNGNNFQNRNNRRDNDDDDNYDDFKIKTALKTKKIGKCTQHLRNLYLNWSMQQIK